jgi:hypothetical protein
MQQPGVITGGGGPSGTGKRPTAESILPPPVFVQDPALAARKANLSSQSGSPKLGASASSDNIAGQEETSNLSLDEKGSGEAAAPSISQSHSKVSVSGNESKVNSVAESKVGNSFESQEKKIAEEKSMSSATTSSIQKSEEKSVANENQSKQSKKEIATSQQSPSSNSNPLNLVSSASFNGIGNCAVFPVPVSSLTVSIWSNLLKSTSDDLKINPFALIALPVTELFELTIPPVDAACMSIWPKPMSYYCQGVGSNGITHAPAGQHVYYRSTGFQENTTNTESSQPSQPIATPPTSNSQPSSQHFPQQSSSSTQRPPSSSSGSSPARFYPPQSQQSSQSQSQPALATLQQMFPSVNMAYGSSTTTSNPNSSPSLPSTSSSYHTLHDSSQRGMFSHEPTLR